MLPYFRRAERTTRFDDSFHGRDGPLDVCDPAQRHPLTEMFMEAASQAGLPYNEDVNGAEQDGYGYFQCTVGRGGRCSTAVGYLRPARLLFTMIGAIGAFEREMMLERQREGIAKAKSEGKYKGRKPTARAKAAEVQALKARGLGATEIAKQLGISRASVYRV